MINDTLGIAPVPGRKNGYTGHETSFISNDLQKYGKRSGFLKIC
jgi:hypothetical protein